MKKSTENNSLYLKIEIEEGMQEKVEYALSRVIGIKRVIK